MISTTLGQLLINQALPPDLQDYARILDKKGVEQLFEQIAQKHPEKYSQIAQRLMKVAADSAYQTGGQSFGIEHLRTAGPAIEARKRINSKLQAILAGPGNDDEKQDAIVKMVESEQEQLTKSVYDEALKSGNPLARQIASGARGNPAQLNRLIAGDLLYVDHRDRTIPIPVLKTYSEGLSPAEYFAGSYGARRGTVQTKLSTADSGYASKLLSQAAHKLLVTAIDEEDEGEDSDHEKHLFVRGLPVETSDSDSVGALLASQAGEYPRNTVLTPKILQALRDQGLKRILVRSPAVGGPPFGGVYARDVGIRERNGNLSPIGDIVGIAAAQALGERLTQVSLSSKHSGGVKGVGPAQSGFKAIDRLMNVPEYFPGGATHTQSDGYVEKIAPAAAGGHDVTVAGKVHYVPPDRDLLVKHGDEIEAGDVLSTGVPNPAQIVAHKGLGEGRRYFIKAFGDAYRNSNAPVARRNVELVARGLLNHVEMTDTSDDYLPGDTMEYNRLESTWRPREGTRAVPIRQALGKYLERPVLHHTIGTQVRKRMLPELEEFGVKELDIHDDPPPFKPVMIRAAASIGEDPDPMVRMLGSYQKRTLLESTHRGRVSDEKGTSFAPSLARGVEYGGESGWPRSIFKG